ncbi:hypothetical protein MMC16_004863 [Acarospora aff. strigata]|nr:hypothetical protein [Acarospora aff. strigata]
MRFSPLTLLVSTALLGLSSAYTTPVGDPSGNPISKPGLAEIVPVGTPYTVTWNPTTAGTVTLVLLRGPSTNVVPLYPIVEKVANTGVYVWTPSAALEPDTSHYGIQLIVDETGQYQYTTQFGISNPAFGASSSSASSSSASSSSATTTATTTAIPTQEPSSSSTTTMTPISQIADGQIQAPAPAAAPVPVTTALHVASAAFPINSANATLSLSATRLTSSVRTTATVVIPLVSSGTAPAPHVAPTGAPMGNSSIVQPTGSMGVPATLQTSATSSSSSTGAARPVSTGAAGRVVGSVGGMVVGAGAVLALLV